MAVLRRGWSVWRTLLPVVLLLIGVCGVVVESQGQELLWPQTLGYLKAHYQEKIADFRANHQPHQPRIYLTTNVPLAQVPGPYIQLLQSLIDLGFEVVEVVDIPAEHGKVGYGVELHVDVGGQVVFCRVRSLSSQATRLVEQEPFESLATVPLPQTLVEPDSELAHATGAAPYSVPAKGYDLPEGDYQRFCLGDTDGDGRPELALLSSESLTLYAMERDGLRLLNRLLFGDPDLIPLHLHHLDLDGDGGDELLITMTRTSGEGEEADHRLASMVVRPGERGMFVLARDLPWYLRVITDRTGQPIALAQSRLGHDQYDGPILKLTYNSQTEGVESLGVYPPAKEIYSLYQFNLEPHDPDRLLILEPSNEVSGYHAPDETIHGYSLRDFGDFKEIAYPQLLDEPQSRGSFSRTFTQDVFAARRFLMVPELDQQCFLIDKGRPPVRGNGLPLLVRRGERNQDGLVGLTWQGTKIRETYQSSLVDRDIVDFGFIGSQGFLLSRDSHGRYSLEILE